MKIYILLLVLYIVSCVNAMYKDQESNNQNKNVMDTPPSYFKPKYDPQTGLEVYDFEISKNATTNPAVVKTADGWTILIHRMMIGGGTYDEYSPAPMFQIIQKKFYPNGLLKQKSIFFQNNLKIGIWEYYDEKGKLIKKVDEDEKFKNSNIQIQDVLDLLEREGWIDQKTGKGATEISILDNQYVVIKRGISISYALDENGYPVWYGVVKPSDMLSISYKIDGITGEVEKSEENIFGEE